MFGSSSKARFELYFIEIWTQRLKVITDSRRAVFHIGNSTYSSKLVDLPCIVETQKTFDNKHMFKVADISQVGISLHVDSLTNEGIEDACRRG